MSSAIDQAIHLYDDQPLGIRAFVRCRHLLCPLAEVERRVPRDARILDLGCGHGLFSSIMALSSPDRSVAGVDPSLAKIQVASTLMDRLPNASFFQGTAEDVSAAGFDAITILDVLYLLPVPEKLRILQRCYELLRPGGQLILKTNDTHPVWKYRWAWFQEVVMTRIGLTLGHGDLHFLSCKENAGLMKQAGFGEVEITHIPTLLPYPHTLLVSSK
ncbi:MAG TPA: class I SAM-dependent methyltransferase [Chloroflexota bacterium]|nr:class I SAM-dependent methyltransferase [Chloroflexota bacterium]